MKNLLFFLFLSILFGCDENKPTEPKNSSPRILSISANPQTASINQEIALSCIATDSDDDSLFVFWFANNGIFPYGNSGNSIQWKSPSASGNYLINVIVSDGEALDSSSISIYIYANEIVIPNENVSYNQHIQPVFNVKCATSGCHDDGTRAGDYSLTNWANANTPGIVNEGNVETSILVWKITGLNGDFMPPINSVIPPLTRNQVDGIKTWIREGAKNN